MSTVCILTNTAGFKETAKRNNISEKDLLTCLTLFQNSEYAEEYHKEKGEYPFPSDAFIYEFFNGGNTLEGPKYIKDWVKRHGNTLGIYRGTEEELKKLRNEFALYTTAKSIHLYQDSEGNFVLSIAPPKISNKLELVDFLQKLNLINEDYEVTSKTKVQEAIRRSGLDVQYFIEGDTLVFPKNNSVFDTSKVDTSKVELSFHDKAWKNDPSKSNHTVRVYLKGQKNKGYFELVKDYEEGFYSVHFKTAKEGAKFNGEADYSSSEERKILFQELVKLIPQNAYVSTWGEISEDGIKGLNNVGRNMIQVDSRAIKTKEGKDVSIPIFQNSSAKYDSYVSESNIKTILEDPVVRDLLMVSSMEDTGSFAYEGKPSVRTYKFLRKPNIKITAIEKAIKNVILRTPSLAPHIDRIRIDYNQNYVKISFVQCSDYNIHYLAVNPNNLAQDATIQTALNRVKSRGVYLNDIAGSSAFLDYLIQAVNNSPIKDNVVTVQPKEKFSDPNALGMATESGGIILNENGNFFKNPGGFADKTLVHEVLHQFVNYRALPEVHQKRLEKIFKQAHDTILEKRYMKNGISKKEAEDKMLQDYYGLTSVDEFASELFLDQNLIDVLNDTTLFEEKERTLFDIIIDWLLDVLGINAKTKIYAEAAEVVKSIIDNQSAEPKGFFSKKQVVFDSELKLIPEQQDAIANAKRFLDDDEGKDFFLISGKAGTGKTTIVQEIIKQHIAINGDINVVYSALSNKAVQVIKSKTDKIKGSNPQYGSLFKLFGTEIDYNDKGDQVFNKIKDAMSYFDTKRLVNKNTDILVIDECSMLDQKTFDLILKVKHDLLPNLKIIFLGDEGQISPINEEDESKPKEDAIQNSISPVFTHNNKKHSKLVVRVRQGENAPILNYADYFWNYNTNNTENSLGMQSDLANQVEETILDDTAFVKVQSQGAEEDNVLDSVIGLYKSASEEGDTYKVKTVVAHRKRAADLNSAIWKRLHPEYKNESPRYIPGDSLMLHSNYMIDDETTLYNGEEYRIVASEAPRSLEDAYGETVRRIFLPKLSGIDDSKWERFLNARFFPNMKDVYFQDVCIEYKDRRGNNIKKWIKVPVPSSTNFDATRFMESFYRSMYNKLSRVWYQTHLSKTEMSALQDIPHQFASADLNYAVTAHKSQGSTYDCVIVDKLDIMGKRGTDGFPDLEKSRMLYTALTRASNMTIIMDDNTPNNRKEALDYNAINNGINKNKGKTATTASVSQKQPTVSQIHSSNNAEQEDPGVKGLEKRTSKDGIEYYVGKELTGNLALTTPKGNIILNLLPENGVAYFLNYIQGGITSPTSAQKKEVFTRLIKKGYDFEDIKKVISDNSQVYKFLLYHEYSHKTNKDAEVYFKNGSDYMTEDKLAIELRATEEALNKLGIKAKPLPDSNGNESISNASSRLVFYIKEIINRNNRFSKLAKLLLDNKALPYNLKYFKIDNNRDDIEGRAGQWNSLANLIEVLGNKVSQETLDKALLHELIHYNTEQLLMNYKNSKPLPTDQKEAIETLYSIIEYSKNYLTKEIQNNKDKYLEIAKRQSATTNSLLFYALDRKGDQEIDEFISEIFTNPGLQEVLNGIPYKETKHSLWDKIKEAIASIFGFEINKGSVLEEALKASTVLIQNNFKSQSSSTSETKINIYAGTGENADLSNFAERPFTLLQYFTSDEQLQGVNAGVVYKSPKAETTLNDWFLDVFTHSNLLGNNTTDHIIVKSVESLFQAFKVLYADKKYFDSVNGDDYFRLSNEGRKIFLDILNSSPKEAKRKGGKYGIIENLNNKEWDRDSSYIMKNIIKSSFITNPQALQRLLATGNATLTHTQDKGKWGTEFPRLLMEVREELRNSNQQPASIISQATLHSGGAQGSDTEWGNIGKEFGLINQNHYRPETLGSKDSDMHKEAISKVIKANQTLKRVYPLQANSTRTQQQADYINGLLERDWLQVKNADAVYAIGSIVQKGSTNAKGFSIENTQVDGGTGYAVQMAIDENKPVFVFDQLSEKWFTWAGNEFIELYEVPTLTTNFAGIGTRGINEAGKKAIRDVYEKTAKEGFKVLNSTDTTKNDEQRFANSKESKDTISSDRTILSNEELKYWNEQGVGEMPRILTASERTDPAFHVKEILEVLNGNKKVPHWVEENDKWVIKGYLSGKDFSGLYLITKHDGLPMLELLETKIPKLIHFSITTLGGTQYEPGVMKYNDLLDRIQDYLKQGLDPESVTIRIDPIVPGVTKKEDIEAVVKRASEMGIKRIRFSIMDGYSNTQKAMTALGYDFNQYYSKEKGYFEPKPEIADQIASFMLSLKDKYGITLGTCAESLVKEGISKEGCLSVAAVNNMLGTSIEDKGTANNDQRKLCSCYGGKVDALQYNKNCASHCVYCYAKHENDKALEYYNEDGTLKDNAFTQTRKAAPKSQSAPVGSDIDMKLIRLANMNTSISGKIVLSEAEQKLYNQTQTLLNNSVISPTQLKQIARLAVYEVSDIITKLQEDKEYAKQIFRGTGKENIDFTELTRIEVIKAVGGIPALMNLVRAQKFSYTHILKTNPAQGGKMKVKTIKKLNLINDNWEGFLEIANSTLRELENIQLDYSNKTLKVISGTEEFDDKDLEDLKEMFGNVAEAWQIGFRQISPMHSLSMLIKRTLNTLKNYDSNGVVTNEFLLEERVSAAEVITNILLWTQHCRTLEDMVNVLNTKKEQFPYLEALINKLTSNDETFKAQFYSNFQKYFCPYIIHYREQLYDPASEETYEGDLKMKIINQGMQTRQHMDTLESMWQNRDQNPMKLYNLSGEINESAKEELAKIHQTILDFSNSGAQELNDEVIGALQSLATLFELNYSKEEIKNNVSYESVVNLVGSLYYVKEAAKNTQDYYNIFTDKDVRKNVFTIVDTLIDKNSGGLESSSFENGKMHYSYVLPSYLTNLTQKLQGYVEDYEEFMQNEYGKSKWFFKDGKWRNAWLRRLMEEEQSRNEFKHAVVLSSEKVAYTDKSPLHYAQTMLFNYFYADSEGKPSNYAYYNMPMMSNKPSEEYIRFFKYTSAKSSREFNIQDPNTWEDYQKNIIKELRNVMYQEIDRIATVRERNQDPNTSKITSFDKNGAKFQFLEYLQDALDAYNESKNSKHTNVFTEEEKLGFILDSMIESARGNKVEIKFDDQDAIIDRAIMQGMKKAFSEYVDFVANEGLFERNADGSLYRMQHLNMGKDEATIMNNLENFFWNNAFAQIQILQLTVIDTAYYKNAEDLQKRLAQLHAPGLRGNLTATDAEFIPSDRVPRAVTDGKTRTVYLKDFDKIVSDAYENVKAAFDDRVEKIRKANPKLAQQYRETYDSILEQFQKINVADAQGYSSPTSYRKKMIIFGKWDKRLEKTYQNIINAEDGEIDIRDLQVLMQPLKPFVYSTTFKDSVGPIDTLKVGVQNKNSEYLLLMMDAIVRGSKRNCKLSAIYKIMEESARDSENNNADRGYSRGIDTIQFESTVKAGLQEPIDINGVETAKEAYDILRKAIYIDGNVDGKYNHNTVHELSFEDYAIQNEVPAHLEGDSIFGSQLRILGVSDLDETDLNGNPNTIKVAGKNLTIQEMRDQYFKAVKDNIEDSYQKLMKELKLNTKADGSYYSQEERNKVLSDLLVEQMRADGKYTYDQINAVKVDAQGRFNVPLSDPAHAIKIQQLLNSIIKSRINKQKLNGGPVVQVTNYGTSKSLDIIFADKDGNDLPTLRQYFNSNKNEMGIDITWEQFIALSKKPSSAEYNKYYKPLADKYQEEVTSKQDAISYIECYAPSSIFKDFADLNGNIDIDRIKREAPDLLQMIGYRIPTEAKYSMAPLRIVGVLPIEAGEGIMLPKDITLLSGSDFDIDKMYIIRPEFEKTFDASKALSDYSKERKIVYDTQAIWKEIHQMPEVKKAIEDLQHQEYEKAKAEGDTRKYEEIIKGIEKKYGYTRRLDWLSAETAQDLFEQYVSKLGKDAPKIKDSSTDLSFKDWMNEQVDPVNGRKRRDLYFKYAKSEGDNRKGRNNIIFDTIWGVLTSNQSMYQILQPGNFDMPKKYGYIAAAMELFPGKYTFEQLKAMDVDDQLKPLVMTKKNLVYNHVHLQFFKQNMTAGKLIGIFAQNNVSHSLISMYKNTGLYIPKPFEAIINLDGLNIAPDSYISYDNMYSEDGNTRISSSLAAFLAAAVDAVKDPVLNFMNVNEHTANVLTTMVRMGKSIEYSMLFLTQPIIKEVVTQKILDGTDSDSLDEYVQSEIYRLQDKLDMPTINSVDINSEDLIEVLEHPEYRTDLKDLQCLIALRGLLSLGTATSDIITQTKFNSVTAAVGPSHADTLQLVHKLQHAAQSKYLDDANLRTALNNPIIRAFQDYTITATNLIMGTNFLEASISFNQVYQELSKYIKFNEEATKDFIKFYYMFVMNSEDVLFKSEDNPNPLSNERFEYILKEVPDKILKAKKDERYKDNRFIKSLFVQASEESKYKQVKINERGMSTDLKEIMGTALQEIFEIDPVFGMELIEYSYKTTGFNFAPESFANLIPYSLRMKIPNYSKALENINKPVNTSLLIDQFVRNYTQHIATLNLIERFKENKEGNLTVMQLQNGTIALQSDEKTREGFPTYFNNNGVLYRMESVHQMSQSSKQAIYRPVVALGTEGHVEINPNEDITVSAFNDTYEEYQYFNTVQDIMGEDNGNLMQDVLQAIIDNIPSDKWSKYLRSMGYLKDRTAVDSYNLINNSTKDKFKNVSEEELKKVVTLLHNIIAKSSREEVIQLIQEMNENKNKINSCE